MKKATQPARARKSKKPKKKAGFPVATAVSAGRYAGFYHS